MEPTGHKCGGAEGSPNGLHRLALAAQPCYRPSVAVTDRDGCSTVSAAGGEAGQPRAVQWEVPDHDDVGEAGRTDRAPTERSDPATLPLQGAERWGRLSRRDAGPGVPEQRTAAIVRRRWPAGSTARQAGPGGQAGRRSQASRCPCPGQQARRSGEAGQQRAALAGSRSAAACSSAPSLPSRRPWTRTSGSRRPGHR